MQTTDLGRAFFHVIRLNPDAPLLHLAPTIEIEEPFRRSLSLIVRLPFRWGLVLGWWRDTHWDPETALMEAVSGWGIDPYSSDLEDPDVKRQIRESVAASGLDPDSEWQVISSLGAES